MMMLCKRCDFTWSSRVQEPKKCPRCLSYRYNTPKNGISSYNPTNVVSVPGRIPSAAESIFIYSCAEKLTYVKDGDWDARIAELVTYCDEQGYSKDIIGMIISQAKVLRNES